MGESARCSNHGLIQLKRLKPPNGLNLVHFSLPELTGPGANLFVSQQKVVPKKIQCRNMQKLKEVPFDRKEVSVVSSPSANNGFQIKRGFVLRNSQARGETKEPTSLSHTESVSHAPKSRCPCSSFSPDRLSPLGVLPVRVQGRC